MQISERAAQVSIEGEPGVRGVVIRDYYQRCIVEMRLGLINQRAEIMETKLNEPNEAEACNPYPQGRWTPRPGCDATLRRVTVPTVLKDVSLRALFWSLSESEMVRESSQRLDFLLEAAAVTPPLLTGMDCPMPEAA